MSTSANIVDIVPGKDKYVYREIEAMPLDESTSFIPGNLSVFFAPNERLDDNAVFAYVGVIHRNAFQVYRVDGEVFNEIEYVHKQTLRLPVFLQEGDNEILQAKWLPILTATGHNKAGTIVILVLCTHKVVHFYNDEGTVLLAKFDVTINLDTAANHKVKAFASVGDLIYAGGQTGDIYVFKYIESKHSVKLSLMYKKIHLGEIQDIFANGQHVASVCSSGTLNVWGPTIVIPSGTEVHVTPRESLTNVLIWNHFVLVSCESGVIKTFDIKKKVFLSMLHAHTRVVTCMDLLAKKNLLLTVSEDAWVRIWQISDSKVNLKLLGTVGCPDHAPVGARFLNPNGIIFGLSCYGMLRVKVFGRPNY